MTKGENELAIACGVELVVIMVMSMWLAFSNMARDEAKEKAAAIESLYTSVKDKYEQAAADLEKCKGSVKVVTQTRTIIKKVPGSWWTSPQDTVRDTIFTAPESTWLWEK